MSNGCMTRRRVLKQAVSVTGLVMCGPFVSISAHVAPSVTTDQALTEVLSLFNQAIGEKFGTDDLRASITANSKLQSIVAGKGAKQIREETLGAALDGIPNLNVDCVRLMIEQRMRSDFAREDFILIDGWMLSRTEALALWLAYV